MLFEFYLGYAPMETEFIGPSLLSRFRRKRLTSADGKPGALLGALLDLSVQKALEIGAISPRCSIIVGSTHTSPIFGSVSLCKGLIKRPKSLRKSVYSVYPEISKNKERHYY